MKLLQPVHVLAKLPPSALSPRNTDMRLIDSGWSMEAALSVQSRPPAALALCCMRQAGQPEVSLEQEDYPKALDQPHLFCRCILCIDGIIPAGGLATNLLLSWRLER